MASMADGLPEWVRSQVSAEWFENERGYWAAREGLLAEYGGQWVAFAGGRVVAAGRDSSAVLHGARAQELVPFLALCGREEWAPRVRREVFPYDATYPGSAVLRVRAELRTSPAGRGRVLDDAIPDTGADLSVLPWLDCQWVGLKLADGTPDQMLGVGPDPVLTMTFAVWIVLDSRAYPCRVQVDFQRDERLLGRDLLNQLDILFRGPAGEVVVNP